MAQINHLVDDHDAVIAGLRRMLDRLDSDQLARQILTASERQIPGYARMAEEVRRGPVHSDVREVIEICRRSVLGSVRPHPDDVRAIEESARQRSAEGMPLEDLLRGHRLGMRLSWRAMRSSAEPGEEALVVLAAEAMLTFVDVVTGIVTRAYLSERAAPVPERERSARQLMAGLDEDRSLTAEEVGTAELLGLRPGGPFVPFAVALESGSAAAYSGLAEQLRSNAVLAVSEGTRTLGLCAEWERLDGLLGDDGVVTIVGYATGPGGIAPACRALRAALTYAVADGRRGRASLIEFAPDVFLAVAPDLADALGEWVVDGLPADLKTTLEVLVDNGFDRRSSAEHLGIHRNTLLHRTARIREISGLDLSTLPGQVTAYLAVRRHGRRATKAAAAARWS